MPQREYFDGVALSYRCNLKYTPTTQEEQTGELFNGSANEEEKVRLDWVFKSNEREKKVH